MFNNMATATKYNGDLDEEATKLANVYRLLREDRDGLCILVTGRAGVGKSALINSIIGEYKAEEGTSPDGVTTKVEKYPKKVGDFIITICDSPGLHCGGINNEKQYLKDLEENCREVDLHLYCVKMTDRMRKNEGAVMKKLSRIFGTENLWRKTLFVLTFANEVKPPRNPSSSSVDYFSKLVTHWKTFLQDKLIADTSIPEEVAKKVPIVPVGYAKEPAANCDY